LEPPQHKPGALLSPDLTAPPPLRSAAPSHDRDTLEKTYEAKRVKYEELTRTLSTLRQAKVRVTTIILSSVGAVYGPSMKDLQKILRCNNEAMKKLERKMSETAILGSLEIWRNNAMQMERGNRDDVNELIAEEEVSTEKQELNSKKREAEKMKRTETRLNKKKSG
jgi:hypothetical protein